MKKRYPTDPYQTTARFNSVCSGCGKKIKKGDPIVYDRYRKLVFCLDGCGEGESILKGVRAEKSMDQFGTDIMYDY